jgi:hypothetical protein
LGKITISLAADMNEFVVMLPGQGGYTPPINPHIPPVNPLYTPYTPPTHPLYTPYTLPILYTPPYTPHSGRVSAPGGIETKQSNDVESTPDSARLYEHAPFTMNVVVL